jgi:Kyakuja-Dileera-Zisupton transposase
MNTLTSIHTSSQVIVCVDANFAQRRRHSHHPNPVDPHPDTHFLAAHEVENMKRIVENARPSEACAGAMALPDDTLDDCEKIFIAAQGHIAKTNNVIFADTALMALLCCHDCPLFLINMTSASKRQYYALALIKALYRHLPNDWVVGLIYDVACQLKRSMRKVRLSFVPVISGLN